MRTCDTLRREMPPAPRLSLVILAVYELTRARRFYVDAFGWTETVATPVYVEFALPDGMRLGLYLREGFSRNTGAPVTARTPHHTTATELYLAVDDLDAWVTRLSDLGARCLSPAADRPWGDRAAYFEDPEGNVLAIVRPQNG